jgi:hypothetical protein
MTLHQLFDVYFMYNCMLTVPGPPEQIKALAMTSDSIMVAWTRPLEPNGNIIKYNVYYHSLLQKVIRIKFPNNILDICMKPVTVQLVRNVPVLLHVKFHYPIR